MHAFLVSAAIVAVAEFGDKTQVLALILAARFRRPLPILVGIASAVLANHAIAGALGTWLADHLRPAVVRIVLAISFIAMGVWALAPERPPAHPPLRPRLGIFGATFVAFFLAEMGDKTQIVTVALAAHYRAWVAVVAGSTVGVVLVDAVAVLLGRVAAERLPLPVIRGAAALLFAGLAAAALLGAI